MGGWGGRVGGEMGIKSKFSQSWTNMQLRWNLNATLIGLILDLDKIRWTLDATKMQFRWNLDET